MIKIISNLDTALIKLTNFSTLNNWSSGFNKLTMELYFPVDYVILIILRKNLAELGEGEK